ncbi:hypothetical protein HOY80DRAFT_1064680 [Tuber brumale]|nr:hypothetical protein HOY80DRAFT_1064680 [Tuber brumale]
MSMVRLAEGRGISVIIGSVTDIEYTESSPTSPATPPPSNHTTPNGPPTSALSSVVIITPSSPASAYALFTEITINQCPHHPSTTSSIPISKQACYLPILKVAGSGGPPIGETRTEGLLMATGHSCRTINNAAGTGKLLSEIVLEGQAVPEDIRQLDPRRNL